MTTDAEPQSPACRCGNSSFGTCRLCGTTFCAPHAATHVDIYSQTQTLVDTLCRECGQAERADAAAQALRASEYDRRQNTPTPVETDQRPPVNTAQQLAEYMATVHVTGPFGSRDVPERRLDVIPAEMFGAAVVLAMKKAGKQRSHVSENRPKRWWHRLGADVQPWSSRPGWGIGGAGGRGWYVTPGAEVYWADADGPGAFLKVGDPVTAGEAVPHHWIDQAAALTLPRPSR